MIIIIVFTFSANEVNVDNTAGDLSETATESDLFGESHNPPFLNEEWLAFLNRTTREVLNKDMDTLRDLNMVRFSPAMGRMIRR